MNRSLGYVWNGKGFKVLGVWFGDLPRMYEYMTNTFENGLSLLNSVIQNV